MCSRLRIFRQRNNGKVIILFFKLHLQHPELLFLHPHSLAFLDKLEESNPSFLARSIVLGLVSEGLRALTFFLEESFQIYLTSCLLLGEVGVFFSVFYQLKARLKSWEVLSFCLWLSIHEQFCWGSAVGPYFCHRPAVENQDCTYNSCFSACYFR